MKHALFICGLLMTLAIPSELLAQQAGYFETNLVSNTAGVATTTDTQLVEPLGYLNSSWAGFLDRQQ